MPEIRTGAFPDGSQIGQKSLGQVGKEIQAKIAARKAAEGKEQVYQKQLKESKKRQAKKEAKAVQREKELQEAELKKAKEMQQAAFEKIQEERDAQWQKIANEIATGKLTVADANVYSTLLKMQQKGLYSRDVNIGELAEKIEAGLRKLEPKAKKKVKIQADKQPEKPQRTSTQRGLIDELEQLKIAAENGNVADPEQIKILVEMMKEEKLIKPDTNIDTEVQKIKKGLKDLTPEAKKTIPPGKNLIASPTEKEIGRTAQDKLKQKALRDWNALVKGVRNGTINPLTVELDFSDLVRNGLLPSNTNLKEYTEQKRQKLIGIALAAKNKSLSASRPEGSLPLLSEKVEKIAPPSFNDFVKAGEDKKGRTTAFIIDKVNANARKTIGELFTRETAPTIEEIKQLLFKLKKEGVTIEGIDKKPVIKKELEIAQGELDNAFKLAQRKELNPKKWTDEEKTESKKDVTRWIKTLQDGGDTRFKNKTKAELNTMADEFIQDLQTEHDKTKTDKAKEALGKGYEQLTGAAKQKFASLGLGKKLKSLKGKLPKFNKEKPPAESIAQEIAPENGYGKKKQVPGSTEGKSSVVDEKKSPIIKEKSIEEELKEVTEAILGRADKLKAAGYDSSKDPATKRQLIAAELARNKTGFVEEHTRSKAMIKVYMEILDGHFGRPQGYKPLSKKQIQENKELYQNLKGKKDKESLLNAINDRAEEWQEAGVYDPMKMSETERELFLSRVLVQEGFYEEKSFTKDPTFVKAVREMIEKHLVVKMT